MISPEFDVPITGSYCSTNAAYCDKVLVTYDVNSTNSNSNDHSEASTAENYVNKTPYDDLPPHLYYWSDGQLILAPFKSTVEVHYKMVTEPHVKLQSQSNF